MKGIFTKAAAGICLAGILSLISCYSEGTDAPPEPQLYSSSGTASSGSVAVETNFYIKNESGVDLASVNWNNMDFGNIPNSGTANKKANIGEDGYMSFTIVSNNMRVQTRYIISVDKSNDERVILKGEQVRVLNDPNYSSTDFFTLEEIAKYTPPRAKAISVEEITKNTATLISDIENPGYPASSEPGYPKKGFCHSSSKNTVTLEINCHPVEGNNFAMPISGIAVGMPYYVATYIYNDNGRHPKQFSETLSFITKPKSMLGCWLDENEKHTEADEICFDGETGRNDWYYFGEDYEGYYFTYTSTDSEISIAVTEAFKTIDGNDEETCSLSELTTIVHPTITLSYDYYVSEGIEKLYILEWDRTYTKQ